MEMKKIEYLRKGHKNKGKKKGVFLCEVDGIDSERVKIGFSLCNSKDRFDYPGGERSPGFGLEIAAIRADKWMDHENCFVQKSFVEEDVEFIKEAYGKQALKKCLFENPVPENTIEIPPSIEKRLRNFIGRCRRYYKDKDFPVWVINFEEGNVISGEDLNVFEDLDLEY